MSDPITEGLIDCWRTNYGLDDKTPAEAAAWWSERGGMAPPGAVAALGIALIEIERLQRALRYEENRFSRIGTHGPDCWKWGPSHYECALRHIGEQP